MKKYTIGVDFGTLSGRAVLVDVATGEEVATSMLDYEHGVMDRMLPDKTPLGSDWALQHPDDYMEVFYTTVPDALKKANVSAQDVIGVAVDFTACTVLPVLKDSTPLCLLEEYKSTPHAYVKLWKHHAAQDEANQLNAIAGRMGEKFLNRYGGKVSSEWLIPKIWQTLNEAPDIYARADYFIEAADWVVWKLTGAQTRNACTAGYKGMWHKRDGYPSPAFFKALDPRMENIAAEKLSCPVFPLGNKAGELTPAMAARMGLLPGTAVAVANVDAHVTVPAVKITGPGKLLAIMGTSSCHIMVDTKEREAPGMCGVVEDGVLPGYYGYEAGQSCVGDHFAWFVENCCPGAYYDEAKAAGMDIHQYLSMLAEKLRVGESGLVALDWWNGNRSVLVDVDLTGMMLGMTLQTTPEQMYRALIEATAYGTRKIIETFRQSGLEVNEMYASGGIAVKNPFAMQIYADVLNMPIRIGGSAQGPALGAAIFAAVAAGKARGGYDTVFEAAEAMGQLQDTAYFPITQNAKAYDALYAEYTILHDYFGRGVNDVMKRLKKIKRDGE